MTTIFFISDIKCSSCKASIEKELVQKKGINSVFVSVIDKTATIDFDNHMINPKDIIEYIKQIGFTAKEQEIFNSTATNESTLVLVAQDIKCSSCKASIEKELGQKKGINDVFVSVIDKTVNIKYNDGLTSEREIINMITGIGYPAYTQSHKNHQDKQKNSHLKAKIASIKVVGNIVLAILVMVLMLFPSIEFILIQALLTSMVIFSSLGILKSGYMGLKNLHPNMYSLIILGSLSGYIYSMVCLFLYFFYNIPFNHLFFDTTAAILSFVGLGDYIKSFINRKVKQNLGDIKTKLPHYVSLIKEDTETKQELSLIKIGDIIRIKAGEMIPLDGILKSDIAEITETLLTGEMHKVYKKNGDPIISGTYLEEESILLEVTATLENSFYYKVQSSLLEIEKSKTPILELVDKISYYFVPVVILCSFISFLFWGFYTSDWVLSLSIGITVLVISCPCALGLATPLAIILFFGTALKQNILVKNTRILDFNKIDTVILDKTGTITTGNLFISDWGITDNSITPLIFSLESYSAHPYGSAISQYIKSHSLKYNLLEVKDFLLSPGKGLQGTINNQLIKIGNSLLIPLNKEQLQTQNLATFLGHTVVWVSLDEKIQGYITLEDKIRPGIKDFISYIKDKGYTIKILSGDHPSSVEFMAKILDIPDYKGSVSPFSKLDDVKNLQQAGHKVMMLGDGLNDSLVLAQADLSFTIGNNKDLASMNGDIIFLNQNIESILLFIKHSQKTNKIIKQNLFWAFIYNIVGLPWAMGFFTFLSTDFSLINPSIAAMAMVISSLVVVINSMRLFKF